jgi:very-short-patch-repair endonuclease
MDWDYESLKRRGLITTGFHLPYNPDLIGRARSMRKDLTPAEKKLWKGLLKEFKFRVLRQRPIDNFIVDFYCPKLKLVIEIDGAGHFKDEGKALDKERTEILKAYGLRVVRFSDHDVMMHFSGVCDRILVMCS